MEEAVKWYRRAAEQGNATAQCNLGYCYDNGQGVEQNLEEAVKWYRKAAEQGNATAQCNLGFCYENGDGIEQNLEEARMWFRKSAEQGNERAQKALSQINDNKNNYPKPIRVQSLQEIIEGAVNRMKNKNICSWNDYKDYILENGRGKIQTDIQADCYLAAYGESHKKKLEYLFRTYGNRLNINQDFEIFDYGCGQGLATISLLENIDLDSLPRLKRITLIDNSSFILNIAEKYLKDIIDSIKNKYEISIECSIRKFSLSLPTANTSITHPTTNAPITIHLFSNVLDMQSIDLKKTASAIKSCKSNKHYVLATHPGTNNVDPNGERMAKFFSFLPNSEVDDTNQGITGTGMIWSHIIGFACF